MYMPVRRIVFLETDKFDGYERRELYPSEIQQIGGRAGRYGIFDEGLVNTLYDVPLIEGALQEVLPQDQEAVVAFPEELLRAENPCPEEADHLKWRILRRIGVMYQLVFFQLYSLSFAGRT